MIKSSFKNQPFSNSISVSVLNGKASSYSLLIIAFLLLIVGFLRPQLAEDARITVTDAFAPVLSFFTMPFQSAAEAIGGVSGVTALRAENQKLQAENMRLKEWYQTALMLQAENESLQDLLNLKIDPAHSYITARVISDTSNAFFKTLLVKVGAQDGVQKNQAVLAGNGMIGRISQVGKNFSRILLLSDINSRVPIVIEGTSQRAILSGDNSTELVLKHLPKDAAIKAGSRVLTSGHGGVFPAGIPIGRLSEEGLGKYVVSPYSDFNKITYVRIIDNSKNKNLIKADDVSLEK